MLFFRVTIYILAEAPASQTASSARYVYSMADSKRPSRRRSSVPAPTMPTNLSLLIRVPNNASTDGKVIRLPTRNSGNPQRNAPSPPARPNTIRRWNLFAPVRKGVKRSTVTSEAETLDAENCAW